MPSTPPYRPTEPPESPTRDSDSDLDLDVNELDPISTENIRESHRGHNSNAAESKPSRIALRNLRMGGLRRANKRGGRGYGDLGQNRDDLDEYARGLLDDQDGGGGSHADDDAPLLGGHQRSQSRRLSISSIRLPSFLSGHKQQQPQLGNDDEALGEQGQDDSLTSRHVAVGSTQSTRFPANIVSNAKYTALTFLPITLYNEFSFFFNMYFLLVALSQAIPALRIGYLSTYIAPLAFVLFITMGKEAYDDIERRRRDNEANSEEYRVLTFADPNAQPASAQPARRLLKSDSYSKRTSRRQREARHDLTDIQEEAITYHPSSFVQEMNRKSKDLKVGDVLKLSKGQRVPADVVILQCYSGDGPTISTPTAEEETLLAFTENEPDCKGKQPQLQSQVDAETAAQKDDADGNGGSGETFIRTDQLDGETDWKLRLASALTQSIAPEEFVRLRVTGGKPDRKVNDFVGTIELMPTKQDATNHHSVLQQDDSSKSAALSIDNTAWANTVIASQGNTLAVILYTGPQTRSSLSTSPSRSKTGLLEYEINSLTKILCALTLTLSVVLVALEGFEKTAGNVWYIKIMRFLVLFSTIVPISLRVNLDMGKSAYSRFIQRDPGIPGAVVRTSTIPEDLGRIEYLLSDKTGTLTQNDMEMKKVHVGTVSYAHEAMDEVKSYVRQGFHIQPTTEPSSQTMLVTPSSAFSTTVNVGATRTRREIGARVRDVVLALALCHNVTPTVDTEDGKEVTSYQASSPDEIAIVKWTESVGLKLSYRDRKSMTLESTETGRPVVRVRVLDVFPFTSDGKRMGIIVHFHEDTKVTDPSLNIGEIWFYQKGADTVMGTIVAANDWLDEETANMAREGLRTLVVGRKKLSFQQYQEFSAKYQEASLSIANRDTGLQRVVSHYLENDLELLGVTGVEDKLQKDVKPSLELLRNAGIKIWMLTGDKVETARCVAVSSKLVARGQYIYTVDKLKRSDAAQQHLDFLRSKPDACLLIDGESLQLLLTHFRIEFISIAVQLPTVVACRCSPTQKAEVAKLIKEYTKKRVCCIGDGGNDVSMIQAADVGVGIVGKEGRQASLAADFSIEQFCHLVKLLVWHGRNSYKRSAKLAQFVIHRGLIIAVCQTMYSIAIKFEPDGLYKDWLLVGYATIYTAAPVLSLVLDKDVDENLANLYPELYKELTEGRSLSYRTFFVWVFVSIYQGGMIQGLSQILTGVEGHKMVAVSYTVLVLNELIMVAIEITTWHPVMILSILGTFLLYVGSIPFLGEYFDLKFVITWGFVWRVFAIGAVSLIPPYAGKLIRRAIKPPSYRKVQNR
ncbi:putative aminophospholipid-translocase [Conoideocrella luteorostrata]|uniref:Phospholipid-transporting ATPase n=1 Tax=Conoideocrella luteorostrata TaxID=1105319 RepID=A0AAJ0CKX3_9HYPO|nr:putative aminophospholipid-translocase [Conoideocrella luteorostrata]